MIEVGGDISYSTLDIGGNIAVEQTHVQGDIAQTSGNSAIWGKIFGNIENQEDLMNKTYNEENFVEITNEEIEVMFR